ncbi:MAG: hypothetical protein LBT86_00455 [Deltaproteobacteria bacterium]|jgi:MraZ protein|nr:hypothetical protein [Deltaproteobacteria bacterium]
MEETKTPNFKGNFPHALDDKGRLTLPSPLREELLRSTLLPERLYLSFFPGNRYLTLYTFEQWNEVSATWNQENRFPSAAVKAAAQRLLFSNVESVSLDKAGRILISAFFREKIGVDLGQKVLVTGVGKKIEVWTPEDFQANELKDLEIWRAAQALDERRGAQLPVDAPRLPEC